MITVALKMHVSNNNYNRMVIALHQKDSTKPLKLLCLDLGGPVGSCSASCSAASPANESILPIDPGSKECDWNVEGGSKDPRM